MTDEFYIGVMSGTSMNAIDAALVSFDDSTRATIHARLSADYPESLLRRLRSAASRPAETNLIETSALNIAVAQSFATIILNLLDDAHIEPKLVRGIGSHGQTVLHLPDGAEPFSLQLGDPGTLAAATGMTVVADFRNTDIALGGQGAPLVPAFHRYMFGDPSEDRAVVNIGGIANVTLLPANGDTTGYDTGPGNVLLDEWCREANDAPYDDQGNWAAGGEVDATLLATLRGDAYFVAAAPKSTGTDYFNLKWLKQKLLHCTPQPSRQDTQATLSELTALEIAQPLKNMGEVAICGGGAFNADLMTRLQRALPDSHIATTEQWGIDPAWVEATAFAWLARERMAGAPTNIPTVTGASASVSLGGIYLAPKSR
jgi:anhydro-N-acetylmuramic acid kinase